jgi:hypothetical protein
VQIDNLMKAGIIMEITYDISAFNEPEAWQPRWNAHENDNVPPSDATQGPVPASIVFTMKLACGGVR